MNIGTIGILVDHLGQVLLIQRNDTRTFHPPGGGLERGELPSESMVREMKEETGLIVFPVRLATLDYYEHGGGSLVFNFRCLLRGGDITPSSETPHVGFYAPDNFPQPMFRLVRERLLAAMHHADGRVRWQRHPRKVWISLLRALLRQTVYRYLDFKRRRNGEPPYVPTPDWQVEVRAVIVDEHGAVLWVADAQSGAGHLPGGENLTAAAPWESARTLTRAQTGLTVQIDDLALVSVAAGESRIRMVFTGTAVGGTAVGAAFHAEPPTNCDAGQRALLHAALRREETEFLRPEAIESALATDHQ